MFQDDQSSPLTNFSNSANINGNGKEEDDITDELEEYTQGRGKKSRSVIIKSFQNYNKKVTKESNL